MASDPSTFTPGDLLERALLQVGRGGDGSRSDRTRTKLLDAAYGQFCENGIARTSMEEVARRAGTARITIYRKFDSKDALVDAVMLREFSRYLEAFREEAARARTVQDRVVSTLVTSLRTIGRNPLIMRLLETEPAMVPGLVGGGDGRTMGEVRRFIAMQLAQEQQAGNIPAHVPIDMAAEMLVRLCASLITTPSDLIDLDDLPKLRQLAREFVLPILGLDSR
ncbi:MAG: TetR/AcrR family transcriptional regulator [Gordonia sp. (in: high G+C Gram-positive bacteria)]|uniref:TetR/AcrR family transcriptional regulator n=1 Tax=Gordonia sp. (in: high G+C Gram-positive bacteria) TaxID=84139 RepID=UPI0039E5F084